MAFENIRSHFLTYNPAGTDREFVRAERASLFDEEGHEFLNLSEISMSLGYSHPEFTKTVAELVREKMIVHGGSLSKDKERMVEQFMEATHGDFDKVFLASSGGEVVDWSLKIARRVSGKDKIVAFRNALHGRSFAGAFISETPVRKAGFGSGLENICFVPYPADGRTSEPEIEALDGVAGIILEPYQAVGMASPSKEYWQWLRKYTREHNIVLILDEVQTGFGKTGSMFAYEETGIVPDVLLLGKGLSNGFGLGALLVTKEVSSHLKPTEMSGGSADNDFMCSVISLVFDLFKKEDICGHVKAVGESFCARLKKGLTEMNIPFRIRGNGLFLGIYLPEELVGKAYRKCAENRILIGAGKQNLSLRAPLTITEEELFRVADTILEAVKKD